MIKITIMPFCMLRYGVSFGSASKVVFLYFVRVYELEEEGFVRDDYA
jgi:hypothetical protein